MRYATLTIEGGDAIHPVSGLLAESGVEREKIVHFDILDDGTVLVVGRLRGQLQQVRQLLAERSDVLAYAIPKDSDGLVYIHLRATEHLEQLLLLRRKHGVFFETPIEQAGATAFRITVVGKTDTAVQQAIADIPASLSFSFERTGEYPMNSEGLASLLTERQLEILTIAVRKGYYNIPRETTHREIATEIGLATGTVSEHLRKVERRVFIAIVGRETIDVG